MSESPPRRSRKESRRSRSRSPKQSKRKRHRERSTSRDRSRGRRSRSRERRREDGRGESEEDDRRHRERHRRGHRSRDRDRDRDREPEHRRQRKGEHRSRGYDEKQLPPPPPPPERPRRDQPDPEPEPEPPQVEQPNFGLSGKLAEETNKVQGVVLKYTEPPDARKNTTTRWRLYVFKGGEALDEPLYIHRNSWYLFGRDRKIVDIPTDHPSCSKQHAVLQYRLTEKEGPDGMMHAAVRPYLMDLGSTNGTYINGDRLDPQRYYELLEKDLLKFGNSSRDFVLLHDKSRN